MSIKNNKPKRNSGFRQGYYPVNECKNSANTVNLLVMLQDGYLNPLRLNI